MSSEIVGTVIQQMTLLTAIFHLFASLPTAQFCMQYIALPVCIV